MISITLLVIPLLGALLCVLWPEKRTRPFFLPFFGLAHMLFCFWLLFNPPSINPNNWLAFDPLTRAILPVVSLLFFICTLYAAPYLRAKEQDNRVFVPAMLLLLGFLSAGLQARHLGLLWIATEAVTLVCVPLIHFSGTPRAVEATWKYLLVCGTGIALSLLGSICLGYASLHGGASGDITFVALLENARHLSRPWVLSAWVLLLIGYGAKMGLAPMHTWKPDTYGESPGFVGALLAGGVTSVAFVAILRIKMVVDAAGEAMLANRTLLALGLFSLIIAAFFLLQTRHFKRMLAYSSIEHMGILCLAASFGSPGVWAALFHVWSNALTKGSLFLSAGNLHQATGTDFVDKARGLSKILPYSSLLFVTGLFAITATPPFGPFFSELRILRVGLAHGHFWAVGILLTCLLLAFLGLSRTIFAVVYGKDRSPDTPRLRESSALLLPPLFLLLASLWLGLFTPAVVRETWSAAVLQLFPMP